MRNNKADEIEDMIIEGFEKVLGNKMEDVVVAESTDEPYPMVSIDFKAYNYYNIRFNYDRGCMGCAIVYGERGVGLESTEKWYDEADLDKFFQDIKEDIESRIPDKFLKRKGWL